MKKSYIAWALYDWANSAFATVILTFVFSVYFGRGVIGDETQGAVYWGYAIAVSGLLIAITAPLLGAAADQYGRHKSWLLRATFLCALCVALLWFITPGASQGAVVLCLALLVLANTAFELGIVFCNALLPSVANKDNVGRISGMSWALGYIGGLFCLVVVLFGFIGLGDSEPLFSIPDDQAQNVRASAPFVALWMIIFTLPIVFFVRESKRSCFVSPVAIFKTGMSNVLKILGDISSHANLARFLIASAIYRDGLNTLFAVGGLYAAGVYGMAFDEILIFAIGLNVTAGIGAFLFSFADDKIGSKPTILMALTGLLALGSAVLMADTKEMFMILALGLGLFIGPAQAASRTMAARLTPPDLSGQTYGFYAFAGKSISFIGPLFYAFATDMFESQRAGMFVILLLWAIGGIILLRVKEGKAA